MFYADLGYNVNVINLIEDVSKKVFDPKMCKPAGIAIVSYIFEKVYHIMLMYYLILYFHLSYEHLNYSHQSEDNIEKTSEYITKIGTNMETMLGVIVVQIELAISKLNYDAMCNELKSLISSDGIIRRTFDSTRKYEILIRQWFFN